MSTWNQNSWHRGSWWKGSWWSLFEKIHFFIDNLTISPVIETVGVAIDKTISVVFNGIYTSRALSLAHYLGPTLSLESDIEDFLKLNKITVVDYFDVG